MRVSGGSECQASITWANSGSSGAYSSPTAAHSAALLKTGSRNVLPTRWLRESARFPSTPVSPANAGRNDSDPFYNVVRAVFVGVPDLAIPRHQRPFRAMLSHDLQPTFKVDLPLRMVPVVELEFSFWESGLLGRQRSRGRRWIARALCLG